MEDPNKDQIRWIVRKNYAAVARGEAGGCCPNSAGGSCCGVGSSAGSSPSAKIGYSKDELAAAPPEADLGLGCGNPQAIAALRRGEVVLDLGSGGGFDCFLAAEKVGPEGKVIGVDMTPEMVSRARETTARNGYTNVEFRLGEIEHLPVADSSVDVVLSNCVINLSPDKAQVFREAFRVLKPGGRLAIMDVVATAPLPSELVADPALYCGCIGGAAPMTEIEMLLRDAGFVEIHITPKEESRAYIGEWAPGRGVESYVVSAAIEAVKP